MSAAKLYWFLHSIDVLCNCSYAGDCDIRFGLKGLKGGVKDFQLSGMLRVVMKPLISQIPLVGGLQLFFLNSPSVDFKLIGGADVLDMPGLRSDITSTFFHCSGFEWFLLINPTVTSCVG